MTSSANCDKVSDVNNMESRLSEVEKTLVMLYGVVEQQIAQATILKGRVEYLESQASAASQQNEHVQMAPVQKESQLPPIIQNQPSQKTAAQYANASNEPQRIGQNNAPQSAVSRLGPKKVTNLEDKPFEKMNAELQRRLQPSTMSYSQKTKPDHQSTEIKPSQVIDQSAQQIEVEVQRQDESQRQFDGRHQQRNDLHHPHDQRTQSRTRTDTNEQHQDNETHGRDNKTNNSSLVIRTTRQSDSRVVNIGNKTSYVGDDAEPRQEQQTQKVDNPHSQVQQHTVKGVTTPKEQRGHDHRHQQHTQERPNVDRSDYQSPQGARHGVMYSEYNGQRSDSSRHERLRPHQRILDDRKLMDGRPREIVDQYATDRARGQTHSDRGKPDLRSKLGAEKDAARASDRKEGRSQETSKQRGSGQKEHDRRAARTVVSHALSDDVGHSGQVARKVESGSVKRKLWQEQEHDEYWHDHKEDTSRHTYYSNRDADYSRSPKRRPASRDWHGERVVAREHRHSGHQDRGRNGYVSGGDHHLHRNQQGDQGTRLRPSNNYKQQHGYEGREGLQHYNGRENAYGHGQKGDWSGRGGRSWRGRSGGHSRGGRGARRGRGDWWGE